MTGCLAETDVARDHGLIDLLAEDRANLLDHLAGQIGALVEHRQQDAVDLEVRVEGVPHALDGIYDLADSLQGQVLGLDRDQHGVGGDQRVERDQTQRGRAIDEDMIELPGCLLEELLEQELSPLLVDQLQFHAHEVAIRRE